MAKKSKKSGRIGTSVAEIKTISPSQNPLSEKPVVRANNFFSNKYFEWLALFFASAFSY